MGYGSGGNPWYSSSIPAGGVRCDSIVSVKAASSEALGNSPSSTRYAVSRNELSSASWSIG